MPRVSAGLLIHRRGPDGAEVLLVHPGGPFWKNKDAGAWSIPKGEVEPGEDPEAAAVREVFEELAVAVTAPLRPLMSIKQKGGKVVHAWAVEENVAFDVGKCNQVQMTWPPGSGKRIRFPEVDGAGYFSIAEARVKINAAQGVWLDEIAGATTGGS